LIILILQPFFLIDVLNVSDAKKVAFSKSEKNEKKNRLQVPPGTGILKAESISNALISIIMIIYTAIPKGFDYNHLKLQSLSFDAQDIHYSS
jgi:hypothetical protein